MQKQSTSAYTVHLLTKVKKSQWETEEFWKNLDLYQP